MTFRSCSYEADVTQALKNGHWPEGCAPELRSHVETCARCSDLVLVTQAFQGARNESISATPEASPSLLWWRAQLRRRNTATERLSRPVTIAQIFALFLYLTVGIVFAAWQYHHGLRWESWWSELVSTHVVHSLSLGLADLGGIFLAMSAFGMVAVLGGIVVYLVYKKA
jgi:hypothetical protein